MPSSPQLQSATISTGTGELTLTFDRPMMTTLPGFDGWLVLHWQAASVNVINWGSVVAAGNVVTLPTGSTAPFTAPDLTLDYIAASNVLRGADGTPAAGFSGFPVSEVA